MRILLALLATLLTLPVARAEFRAATAKVDITPTSPQWLMGYGARKSTGVRDPIYHRIAALDDGATQVYLIASDLCIFSPTVYHEVTDALKQQMGIEPRQVWWTVTHSHSTPEVGPRGMYDILLKGRSEHPWDREYCEFVKAKLIEGIRQAREKLVPARVAIGTGISRANINRRARDADGKISLGLNPDGPADRQVGLIRIERLDGSPLGYITNYAMHGTVFGSSMLQISGDGPGIVTSYLEEKLGATTLYINGAAGNLAPIYSVQEVSRSHIGEFRVLLGDRIVEASRTLGAAAPTTKLWLGELTIETPRKEGLGWSDELKRYAAKGANGTDLVRIPVHVLRLNDAVLWGSPLELFCEIALNVRRESPFRHNFFFGYMNGWLGYLPTGRAFQEGGYEPRTSPFSAQAERDYTEGVLTYLSGLPRD